MFQLTPLVEANPSDEPKREVSSTQVELPELLAPVLRWSAGNLSPGMYAGKGLEYDTHVTVRFGLDVPNSKGVRKIAAKFGKPITLRLGPLKSFQSDKWDVLWVSVVSKDLRRLNKMLGELPHITTHPVYTPHLTVAYLKPGLAKPFIGKNVLRGKIVRTGFMLSKPGHRKEFISTTGSGFAVTPLS